MSEPRIKRDGTLRYLVASRTRPDVKHLCELDHYDFNGACSCEFFTLKLEPLLKRGVTPERASAEKLVKLKNKERPQDALRCSHLVDAWMQWGLDAAKIVMQHEKNPTQAKQ